MEKDQVSGTTDSVDAILDQWREAEPDLPVAPVGVITRLARVRAHLDTALAEVFAGYDLTPADFQALVTLRRIGDPYRMNQAELMRAMGLTSGTISLRLARLEQRGIVVREPDPHDKRGATVRLTPQGLDLFERIAPAHLRGEERLLSALAPDEQDQLAALLRKLLASYEHTGATAAQAWGMTLEPAHTARRRRAAVGLSDPSGLLVTRVRPDSPAHRAAIEVGDLITHWAGHPVRTPADLNVTPADLDAAADPSPVTLTLLRGETPVRASIHLPAETA
jgi:DNA-binding MarR family transcriptional regulator